MTMEATADYARVPAILSFPDTTGFAETYGFGAASGRVWLEGQYLVPSERASKTLYLFMHPSSTLHLLPMPAALVGGNAVGPMRRPPSEYDLTLRQADQARSDFAAIEDGLELFMAQMSKVPTQKTLAWVADGSFVSGQRSRFW
jgi:hypothetical protein